MAVVADLSAALRSQENAAVRHQITPATLKTCLEPSSSQADVLLCTNMLRLSPRKAKIYV